MRNIRLKATSRRHQHSGATTSSGPARGPCNQKRPNSTLGLCNEDNDLCNIVEVRSIWTGRTSGIVEPGHFETAPRGLLLKTRGWGLFHLHIFVVICDAEVNPTSARQNINRAVGILLQINVGRQNFEIVRIALHD